jgi:hypothetical protein
MRKLVSTPELRSQDSAHGVSTPAPIATSPQPPTAIMSTTIQPDFAAAIGRLTS